MRLPLRVAHAIRSRKLIAPRAHVLIALSGGPDSVALLRCLVELSAKRDLAFRLSAAHLHHGIRGKDADADQTFCEKLCAKFKLPLLTARADTPALARELKRSLEETARILRHAFLADAAEQLACNVVAVGHHADDRIETVLFRLCRGTGIAGLQGIGWTGPTRLKDEPDVTSRIIWPNTRTLSPQSSVLSPPVCRPLLACSRAEVLAYLKSKRQRFCTDETNFDTAIPRNALRKIVLPALEKKVHAGARAALWRLSEESETQSAQQVWRREWLAAFAACGTCGELTLPAPDDLPLPSLAELSDALEVLRTVWKLEGANFTVRHAQALQQLFLARSGPKELHFPAKLVAQRSGKWVTIRRPC